MRKESWAVLTVAIVAGLSGVASAAISYGTEGSTYNENFDSRVNSQQANVALTFADDSTVPGWYLYQPGGGTTLTTAGPGTAVFLASGISSGSYAANFYRTSTTGPVYGTDVSFGTQNFNGNSASSATGTTNGGTIYFGFGLTNNTGSTLHSFTLSYNAELWSTNNANATTGNTSDDGQAVSYALGATGVADSQGTYVPTNLGFTVPAATIALNTTSFATPSGQVTNINWLPGQTLFIRYGDLNVVGNDRGMAVDDIAFSASSAVPEPASLALIGVGALTALRRRRA